MIRLNLSLVFLIAAAGCGAAKGHPSLEAANAVLDDWHLAAAEADRQRYIGYLAEGAVFMGTDASERWAREEFDAFVAPYFDEGQGWTYRPRDRHVTLSSDGRTAWFDERLDNDKYGELRGTGVLLWIDDGWKLAHYNMSFPVPNEVTGQVIEIIGAAALHDAGP